MNLAVSRLGQSLNLTVIAEGVETQEQLAMLEKYGYDGIQGYLSSKPIPIETRLYKNAVRSEPVEGRMADADRLLMVRQAHHERQCV